MEGFLEEAGFEQHPEVKKSRGMWVPRWQSSLEATALEKGAGLGAKALLAAAASLKKANYIQARCHGNRGAGGVGN